MDNYFFYTRQMWQRLVLALLLALAAYLVLKKFSVEGYTNWDNVVETPALGPPIREPKPRGDMVVSPGGPNPPNQAAPPTPPTLGGVATPSDPYSVTQEDADAPERITHPELSFGPGVVPEQTGIAATSGLANSPQDSAQAFQTFSPEFVQNGGAFFGGVGAMEDENPNYSSF